MSRSFLMEILRTQARIRRTGLLDPIFRHDNTYFMYDWLERQEKRLIFRLKNRQDDENLRNIKEENVGRSVIISPPIIDWHISLFQRPQHMAMQLAKMGYLYFFCTDNSEQDSVWGFERLAERLVLTNRCDRLMAREVKHILHIYSTSHKNKWPMIERELEAGNVVLYEFIDEIDPVISRASIPHHVYELHERILKDERCIVIATSEVLYEHVLKVRSKNCALVTNGVDPDHFPSTLRSSPVPDSVKDIVSKGRPIIGYYGALASWFDYELVIGLAKARPDYEIVLIGPHYDRSFLSSGVQGVGNIHVLDPVPYEILPQYACRFDVAMIPFLINHITESTSPLKLFEYMAMGLPVVTTGMKECRKYRSVLIGEDHQDFIAKVDKALELRKDQAYLELLRQEAQDNSWAAKAKVIDGLIRQNMSQDVH